MAMYFSEQGFYSDMKITKFDRGEGAANPKSRMNPYFVITHFESWTRYNHRSNFLNNPHRNYELIRKIECYF